MERATKPERGNASMSWRMIKSGKPTGVKVTKENLVVGGWIEMSFGGVWYVAIYFKRVSDLQSGATSCLCYFRHCITGTVRLTGSSTEIPLQPLHSLFAAQTLSSSFLFLPSHIRHALSSSILHSSMMLVPATLTSCLPILLVILNTAIRPGQLLLSQMEEARRLAPP
jgi:hypothetical protein